MNGKVIDYKIIQDKNEDRLSQIIYAMIEEWQPMGGVAMIMCGNTGYYVQAMVKYKPVTEIGE